MQKSIITTVCLFTIQAPLQAQSATETELKAEAMSIVKQFAGSLKPALKKAMQEGGPVKAIDVCSVEAPAIAKRLSLESGWQVTRVSLKARNDKTAVPDTWETKVLQQFDDRQAKGETAEKMAFAEQFDGEFRFMKAQGTEPLCLTCHGDKLSAEVEQALKVNYPKDMARGYSLGQIRGAISLSKEL